MGTLVAYRLEQDTSMPYTLNTPHLLRSHQQQLSHVGTLIIISHESDTVTFTNTRISNTVLLASAHRTGQAAACHSKPSGGSTTCVALKALVHEDELVQMHGAPHVSPCSP